jgi:predicted RNA-binding protein with PUA-like domain
MPGTKRGWFFQAQPKEWDVDGFLSDVVARRTDARVNWLVTTYADQISVGDRVFLWRSGPKAGVVAVARVLAAPAVLPEDKGAYRLAPHQNKYAQDRCRARLEVERVLRRPLLRAAMKLQPAMADLSIMTNFRRTNVPVDDRHVPELERLCAARCSGS